MDTNFSSTAVATSDIRSRLEVAMNEKRNAQDAGTRIKLTGIMEKIRSLRERGLLKEQEFYAPTTADFERIMLPKKPNIQNS